MMPSVDGSPYPIDQHWEKYVLTHVHTMADAQAFMKALGGERCAKVRSMRYYFKTHAEFWTASPERIRAAIASNRRVGCSCHETGSFAPRR